MRKWTKSACVVFAWCSTAVLVTACTTGSARSAQANQRIANSITRVTLASNVELAGLTGNPEISVSAPRSAQRKASATTSYVVRSGDTLSGIAIALTPAATARAGHVRPVALVAHARGGLPPWLQALLVAAGVLIVASLLTGLVLLLARRRGRERATKEAVKRARVVLADYERLIVTYSVADDTVYVLTPPGEDPRAVLRAARLVLPDDTYEELAGHLGIPANWPLE